MLKLSECKGAKYWFHVCVCCSVSSTQSPIKITSGSFSRHSDKNRLCYDRHGMQLEFDLVSGQQWHNIRKLTMLIHRSSSELMGTGTIHEFMFFFMYIYMKKNSRLCVCITICNVTTNQLVQNHNALGKFTNDYCADLSIYFSESILFELI